MYFSFITTTLIEVQKTAKSSGNDNGDMRQEFDDKDVKDFCNNVLLLTKTLKIFAR